MGFLSWFKKDSEKDDIVINAKDNAIESAAVEAFAGAGEHEQARSIMARETVPQKIMMLSAEDHFSNMLINYVLDMAKRMGCEVVAVNVMGVPRSLPLKERKRAMKVFEETTRKNIENLTRMADSEGVKVTHMIEFGDPEKVADKLHASDPGIRCVVTEPEESNSEYNEELIPVYCFA